MSKQPFKLFEWLSQEIPLPFKNFHLFKYLTLCSLLLSKFIYQFVHFIGHLAKSFFKSVTSDPMVH